MANDLYLAQHAFKATTVPHSFFAKHKIIIISMSASKLTNASAESHI